MSRIYRVIWLILVAGTIWVSLMTLAPSAFGVEVGMLLPPTGDPQLQPSSVVPFWATYNDFRERRLTVDESLQNIGGCLAGAINISNIEADNGVIIETPMPIDLGELPATATGTITITVKYRVPPGVSRFRARLHAVCRPGPPPPPPTASASYSVYMEPGFAYANEGCPLELVSEAPVSPLPDDQTYAPRRFTVTVKDTNGNPVAGKKIDWWLSNMVQFRIIDGSAITDDNGQAFAVVSPPMFFVCISPYFDRRATLLFVGTEGAAPGQALFAYTRCTPPGMDPPWSTPPDQTPLGA